MCFLGGLGVDLGFQFLFFRALFLRSRPCFFCPGRAYGSGSFFLTVDVYTITPTIVTVAIATVPTITHPTGFHAFATPIVPAVAKYLPPAIAKAQKPSKSHILTELLKQYANTLYYAKFSKFAVNVLDESAFIHRPISGS